MHLLRELRVAPHKSWRRMHFLAHGPGASAYSEAFAPSNGSARCSGRGLVPPARSKHSGQSKWHRRHRCLKRNRSHRKD